MDNDEIQVVAVNLGSSPYRSGVGGGEKKEIAPCVTPRLKKARHEAAQSTAHCVGPHDITVERACTGRELEESRPVVFRLHPSAYRLIPENDRVAFALNDFDRLQDSRLKNVLCSVAGLRRPIDISHLGNADLLYEIMDRKQLGAGPHDTMFFRKMDPTTLVMRTDLGSGHYTGDLHPSIAVEANDIHNLGSGCILVGPPYVWPQQKLGLIPDETKKAQFYDLSLHGLEDDGTKLGDALEIRTDSDGSNPRDVPLEIITGRPGRNMAADAIVLCGKDKDVAVRVSMGISFEQDPRDHAAIWFGNPSLVVCHGYVESIRHLDGESWLNVQLALARDNLPSYLIFSRTRQDALFQTNLRMRVRGECVLSAMHILPLPLHNCPDSLSDNKRQLGIAAPQPLRQNTYVTGHMEFDLGLFRKTDDHQSGDHREISTNTNHKALELLSFFCARGGPITVTQTDPDHLKCQAAWKAKFIQETARRLGGLFEPKVTLLAVDPFPPEQAVSTIANCSQMLGSTGINPQLAVLRAALRRLAELKSKRTKNRVGRSSAVSFIPNVSGSVLFQLLHKFVRASDYIVLFKEGAVVASVKDVNSVAAILGTEDGVIHLEGGQGSIQFFGPVNFKLILFDSKRSRLDSGEGLAEITFNSYLSMDRHGGQLTGALYEGNGGDGTGRKHKSGIWPESTEEVM